MIVSVNLIEILYLLNFLKRKNIHFISCFLNFLNVIFNKKENKYKSLKLNERKKLEPKAGPS